MADYSTITCAPNRPARYLDFDDAGGALMHWTDSGSTERTVDREFAGYGTVVHYLGVGSKVYSGSVRVSAATVPLCQDEVQKWQNLRGSICDVTVNGVLRDDETLTSMKLQGAEPGRYVNGSGEVSNVLSVAFMQLTQLGGNPV